MAKIDPLTTAVVNKKFKFDKLKNDNGSLISLDLDSYKPNHLTYKIKNPSKIDQFAVFSEIYYKNGWNAYIDGKIVPHFRANYVLRAMIVPAGTKKIEFKFEPSTFETGEKVALASSIILLLLLVFLYPTRNLKYNEESFNYYILLASFGWSRSSEMVEIFKILT